MIDYVLMFRGWSSAYLHCTAVWRRGILLHCWEQSRNTSETYHPHHHRCVSLSLRIVKIEWADIVFFLLIIFHAIPCLKLNTIQPIETSRQHLFCLLWVIILLKSLLWPVWCPSFKTAVQAPCWQFSCACLYPMCTTQAPCVLICGHLLPYF